VGLEPDSLRQKALQTTLPANVFLGFVNVAFYSSGFFFARQWWTKDRILLPR
jgi:hypothetical protein